MTEERDLKPGEMIYLDLNSQKKPSFGGSKNWVLIQDLDTKQKWSLLPKAKEDLNEKFTPFLNKMKAMKNIFKIIFCDNAGEKKTFEENCANNFEEIKFG